MLIRFCEQSIGFIMDWTLAATYLIRAYLIAAQIFFFLEESTVCTRDPSITITHQGALGPDLNRFHFTHLRTVAPPDP